MNIRLSVISLWVIGLIGLAPHATVAQSIPSFPSSPVTGPNGQINSAAISLWGTCGSGEQRNDKILLSKPHGLYFINPDGTRETEIIHNERVRKFHGAWSHQGDKIVYSVFDGAPMTPCMIETGGTIDHPDPYFFDVSSDYYDIHLVNPNGTDDQNITADLPACYAGGDFSIDDRKVVFYRWAPFTSEYVRDSNGVQSLQYTSQEPGRLHIMVKDLENGTVNTIFSANVVNDDFLLYDGSSFTPPFWCNRDEIIFMSPPVAGGRNWFNLLSPDSSEHMSLEGWGEIHSHPNCGGFGDQEKLVFTEYSRNASGGIALDGGHLEISRHPHVPDFGTPLAVPSTSASEGTINHRGTKVAYLVARPLSAAGYLFDIHASDIEDPENEVDVTARCGGIIPYDSRIVWSPDDQKIAFEGRSLDDSPAPLIYVAAIDGSSCRFLTVGSLLDWSPLRCARVIGTQTRQQRLQPTRSLQPIRPRKQSGKR